MSQPRHGFRAGLDSILLGAAVAPDRLNLLDLGCGVGTAALVALANGPGLSATLAEKNAEMALLAEANAAQNGFGERTRVLKVDVTAKGAERNGAGLMDNAFDTVVANPPFFEDGAGTLATDTARANSRHMDGEALDLWVRTAAGCAAGGAEVIFIYPAERLSPLLAAFTGRFGAITILPLASRPKSAASRVILRGIKGSRAPLTLASTRILHTETGRGFQPEFDAIFRGTARLVW